MTCQLILSALSYYLLACGNYTSNCNTLYNTTQQSLILCNQKDAKQVFQEMDPVINESYKNITHTEPYTMVTTTATSMVVTTTDSPQEEIPYQQHNQSEHPLLRGSTTIVNLTNTTRLNESIPMNQSYRVNMSNLTNASVGTNYSVAFTRRSENLSSIEREDHSVHNGLSIGFAVIGLLIIVGGAYKCNKMHTPKKKKRKSIRSVTPEPDPEPEPETQTQTVKNRNSWTANTADIKLKMHKKRPVAKPFEKKKMEIKEITTSAPPGLPPPPYPVQQGLPPVPPRVMKVKDLHKKDSLNMLKELRQHKRGRGNGVKKLKSQMHKLRAINNMNKLNKK